MHRIGILMTVLLMVACSSTPRAPVIDRAPGSTAGTRTISAKPSDKDWRPDTYTVKKGDTLYSIGLEYGYDYKEIAQTNNIPPPYTIYVGQQLKLKTASSGKEPQPPIALQESESSGVVITPLDVDGGSVTPLDGSTDATATPMIASSSEPPLISEPKALRQPYSEQALNAPIVPAKAAVISTPPATAAASAPTEAQPADGQAAKAPAVATPEPAKPTAVATNGDITWAWPTRGKVLSGFNEGGNAKGIDIGGTAGQPILAAAPGKVIYSGSDLRGYGKLVIIKHNATYLSVYAHNSNILVKEGQQVSRGQKIAEMGNTDTDRIKLHFEIRRQGKSVDPANYLPANPG